MKTASTSKKTIQLFWNHALRYKRYLFPLFVTVPITIVLGDILGPYILSRVLAIISSGGYNPNDLWGAFGGYILVYAISTYVWGVLGWRFNVWMIWSLENRVIRDLNQRVFSHLLSMSTTFHANRFSGSLVSQTNKLTGAYVRFADSTVFNLYTLIISLVATMVVLGPKVPVYAVTMLVFAVVFILGTIKLSRPVRDANSAEATAQSKQTGELADAITNIMAIKSFARGDYEKSRFAKTSNKVADAGYLSLRTTTSREIFASTITTSIGVAALLIAVLGTKLFGNDIATLFLIVSYTGNIGMRLWEFQNILRQYNRAFGDAKDMVEILDIQPGVKDVADPLQVEAVNGNLDFDKVTFTHDGSPKPLFNKLNFSIGVGEKVGLVGHSGSGKTTLTRLVLRYSDIDSGTIRIGGHDISKLTQDNLRRHISYVPQEPLLFHRSLAENIAYGKPGATKAEIERVAEMAHAHEFIKDLPDGYDTLVGERGVKLSGGQRQRVAIARAMLKDAPVLLLDEATSALDSESEVLIQDALWKLMEGRTTIVIAHRLSTIQKMDRIIVMDDGKILEEGSHAELLKKSGKYAELWKHQSGGFLED
ncbi:ABC transporter ATP-binding protein [Candidatus Saccharibacteria bacterium]|nr:MAG: ABC transporter ATP-binding protein [Candidatus Saccharibacteria bacterium]